MGRKGVSKRKPKKSGSIDNNNHGSSNARPGQSPSSVQSLVNVKDAPRDRGSNNPSDGSNKKNQKRR
jgi:hypothetical protein